MRPFFFLMLIVFVISGCSSSIEPVLVMEGWHQKLDSPTDYIVKPHETLYSIAWNYGLDYRAIAVANNIKSPYHVKAGQKLYLNPSVTISKHSIPKKTLVSKPVSGKPQNLLPLIEKNIREELEKEEPMKPASTRVLVGKTSSAAGILWAWPARGQILNSFCACGLNKGIDISGKLNAPITAAAAGKVVYAGGGLRGYGELIIIKHSDEFLSAYAHNEKLLVREGQSVKVGQIIALMGRTEANCVMVHFEIRKAGKPVNPIIYLPKN